MGYSSRFLVSVFLLSLTLTACGLAQAVSPATTNSRTTAEYSIYTVQSGDTASKIAARFHLTIEQLIALNVEQYPSLARDPSTLRPGWRLRVPGEPQPTRLPETPPQVDLALAEQQITDSINAARAQRGLLLLGTDVTLTHIARNRSADMIARSYFSHYDPQTGQEPLLRYLQATNFAYRYAGENIAELKNEVGWVPPWLTVSARYEPGDLADEFVKGWLNSPEHRANILNARYRRTGVALAVSDDGRRIVATQAFSD